MMHVPASPGPKSFTPGPWQMLKDTCSMCDGEWVITGPPGGRHGQFLHEADARLIAAAPDLLEACRHVLAWFARIKRQQYKDLVLGQTLESASANWDKMTTESLDLAPLMKAVAAAEGKS